MDEGTAIAMTKEEVANELSENPESIMRKTNPWLNSLLAGDGISRKALQKEADDLWAESVKLRDKSRCLRCLGTTNLNAHHIFSRNTRQHGIYWKMGLLCADIAISLKLT